MSKFVISIETPDGSSITGFYPIAIGTADSLKDARRMVLSPVPGIKKMITKGRVITAREGHEFGTAFAAAHMIGGQLKEISDKTIPKPSFVKHITEYSIPKFGWWKELTHLLPMPTAETHQIVTDVIDSLPIGYRMFRFDAAKRIVRECMYKTMSKEKVLLTEEMLSSTELAMTRENPDLILDLLIRSARASVAATQDDHVMQRYLSDIPELASKIIGKEDKIPGGRDQWLIYMFPTTRESEIDFYEAMQSVGKILRETIPVAEVALAAMIWNAKHK